MKPSTKEKQGAANTEAGSGPVEEQKGWGVARRHVSTWMQNTAATAAVIVSLVALNQSCEAVDVARESTLLGTLNSQSRELSQIIDAMQEVSLENQHDLDTTPSDIVAKYRGIILQEYEMLIDANKYLFSQDFVSDYDERQAKRHALVLQIVDNRDEPDASLLQNYDDLLNTDIAAIEDGIITEVDRVRKQMQQLEESLGLRRGDVSDIR